MIGLSNNIARPIADPVQNNRNMFIDQIMNIPAIGTNAVSGFIAKTNANTGGVDVSFQIANETGVSSVTLLRASVMDIAQATVLQTWTAGQSTFTWSDTDAELQRIGSAYYWVRLEPQNLLGNEVTIGPQLILLNPSLQAPLALSAISASHGAAANGFVLVTANVSAIPAGDSVKIYVTGYQGNPSAVAVAQNASAPMQFKLQATGETITLEAIAVSSGGTEAASGPTCTLTLNGSATAAAQIQDVQIAQISTGNQLSWPSSLEAGITQYQIYRGQRGAGFGSASLLATVSATSAGEVIYLDTGGLAGDYEYYVIAVAGSGNSPASVAVNPIILFSSSQLPPNTPTNAESSSIIDSIDGGTSATIRIYGGGGVGTSYTITKGYGTVTRPAGSITGLAYTTIYYVLFNVAAATYVASTSYTDSLPDGLEWVGVIHTAAAGSATPTATAGINGSGNVVAVSAVNQGYGVGSASVSFSGGGGAGASADPVIRFGQVLSYTVTNGGTGYTSAPSVTVTVTSTYAGGGAADGGQRYVKTQTA